MVPVTPPFLFLLEGAVFQTKTPLTAVLFLQEISGISYKNKNCTFDSFKYKRIYDGNMKYEFFVVVETENIKAAGAPCSFPLH